MNIATGLKACGAEAAELVPLLLSLRRSGIRASSRTRLEAKRGRIGGFHAGRHVASARSPRGQRCSPPWRGPTWRVRHGLRRTLPDDLAPDRTQETRLALEVMPVFARRRHGTLQCGRRAVRDAQHRGRRLEELAPPSLLAPGSRSGGRPGTRPRPSAQF